MNNSAPAFKPQSCVPSVSVPAAYAKHMSVGVLVAYAKHIPSTFQSYAKHMPSIFQAYSKHMPSICQAYAKAPLPFSWFFHVAGQCLI